MDQLEFRYKAARSSFLTLLSTALQVPYITYNTTAQKEMSPSRHLNSGSSIAQTLKASLGNCTAHGNRIANKNPPPKPPPEKPQGPPHPIDPYGS